MLDIIIAIAVAAVLVFSIIRFWKNRKNKQECSSCPSNNGSASCCGKK